MVNVIDRLIPATDAYPIAIRLFQPSGDARGNLIIASAMGVPQTYYEALARWAAAHGFVTASFDYRGIGRSRAGSLRGLEASILDWARLDCAAVVEELTKQSPDLPLYWLGHSLGGQIIPYVSQHHRIRKIVTVAAGSGYWLENAPPLKRRVWLFWFFAVPLTVPIFGYFPGRILGLVGDLPKPVIRQWRQWCLNPDYLVGVEADARDRFASVRAPIVSLSFTDDEMMSARNIESLHDFYREAPRTMKRLDPQDVGLARIGHFGFFRPEAGEALWPAYLLPELTE